jgi:hypothetical protein
MFDPPAPPTPLTKRTIVLLVIAVIAATPLLWFAVDSSAGDKLLKWTSGKSADARTTIRVPSQGAK